MADLNEKLPESCSKIIFYYKGKAPHRFPQRPLQATLRLDFFVGKKAG